MHNHLIVDFSACLGALVREPKYRSIEQVGVGLQVELVHIERARTASQ